MIYSHEVELMCPVAKGAKHEPAPIPEKNARGTLNTNAQGQLITRNVNAV